jgi:hypothetical protein
VAPKEILAALRPDKGVREVSGVIGSDQGYREEFLQTLTALHVEKLGWKVGLLRVEQEVER